MKLKTWLWLAPFILIFVAAAIWLGGPLLENAKKSNSGERKDSPEHGQKEEFKVVNTPVSKSIIEFKSEGLEYGNGHEFISSMHDFYNETLGWGGIKTASYATQQEKAAKIISVLDNIEVNHKELKKDFEEIQKLAQRVINKDDRTAMRKLHRYFHDLDIILNGYDYDQTFNITSFKGA